jgi:hypothetical protein
MNKHTVETQLLSRNAAAKALGIQPQTLASWATNGKYSLPFVKIGSRAMYRVSDLEAFIANNLVIQGGA